MNIQEIKDFNLASDGYVSFIVKVMCEYNLHFPGALEFLKMPEEDEIVSLDEAD